MGIFNQFKNLKELQQMYLEGKSVLYYNSDTDLDLGGLEIFGTQKYVCVTEFIGIKEFKTLEDAKDTLCKVSVFGAVLSKNDDTYVLWNGDSSNYEWDPYSKTIVEPTNYGDPIAVCLGHNMWIYLNWSGLTEQKKWANTDTELFAQYQLPNFHGTGYEATKDTVEQHNNDLNGTIWEEINVSDYDLFIPSHTEMVKIFDLLCIADHVETSSGNAVHKFDSNICKLIGFGNGSSNANNYWTSSQQDNGNTNDASKAISIAGTSGLGISSAKDSTFYSLCCINFE